MPLSDASLFIDFGTVIDLCLSLSLSVLWGQEGRCWNVPLGEEIVLILQPLMVKASGWSDRKSRLTTEM